MCIVFLGKAEVNAMANMLVLTFFFFFFANVEGHLKGFPQVYLCYFPVLWRWLLMKRKREGEEGGGKKEKEGRKNILNFYLRTKIWAS